MKNRDCQHLAKLRDYYARHGVLPSFSGIANILGFKATSAVACMMERLKPEGYFSTTPEGRLQPGPRFFEYTVVNTVQAGAPQPLNDVTPYSTRIDERLVKVPSMTVLAKVKGESMLEAGLMPGDTVIVEREREPNLGDVVVAIIDGETTIKYWAKDSGGFYLRAGNREFKDRWPRESLTVYGVVVGSFRAY